MAALASLSGLALKLASTTSADTFDLANTPASAISDSVEKGFAAEFDAVLRITLVVGGGKLCRGKYDQDAFKAVRSALQSCGYLQDTEGGNEMEGGAFKSHHDTGKNLKTVVSSPSNLVAVASLPTFRLMVASKAPTWSEKKAMIAAIEEVEEEVGKVEAKVLKGETVGGGEEKLYSSVESLEEKKDELKKMMASHVEEGTLTRREKEVLLGQVESKIGTAEENLKGADGKKKDKIEEVMKKLKARKELIEGAKINWSPPLKAQPQIDKLRKELIPLMKIEEKAKGRLMNLKETEAMGQMEEIRKHIDALEEGSSGWFESVEEWTDRVMKGRKVWEDIISKRKAKKESGGGGGGGGKYVAKQTTGTSWVTPGRGGGAKGRKVVGGVRGGGAAGGGAAKKKGSLFQQMMEDSSDEDSD
ncbi:hypothetical protein TrCOL_g9687 [Triparma columacea]|uniref:Uncharacterized protein n=1 Tax=Triparma columacea TaxID=722753 RepID=A0A9W7LBF1_9STRA|nr:hypothetical protein TrCOL_g9687 [Triparma columacea]